MSAQWWKRIFLGNAVDVELDGAGRPPVSPELRAAAGISRDTMLLGMGNRFRAVGQSHVRGAGGAGHARHHALTSSRTSLFEGRW
jgi:hypothetical protein